MPFVDVRRGARELSWIELGLDGSSGDMRSRVSWLQGVLSMNARHHSELKARNSRRGFCKHQACECFM